MTKRFCDALALTTAVAALSACTVGQNYERPSVPIAPQYVSARSAATHADLVAWWHLVNDPILDAMVERALSRNLDIEQSAARIDQAGATLGLARADLLPSGDISGSYRRSYESVAAAPGAFLKDIPGGYPRNQNNFLLNAAASWEIDLFGGTRRANEAARADLAGAVADAQAVRVSTIAMVVDLYVQLRRAQSERLLNTQQLVLERRDTTLSGLLAERGIIARSDFDRTGAGLADSETRTPELDASEAALLNSIDILLGDPPGTNHATLAAGSGVPELTSVPALGAPVDLLANRPDVIAAEARLRATNARIGQAKAEYFPKISLSGLLGVASLTGANLFSTYGLQASGTVGLRWRLFDFKRIDAEIAQAKGQYREQLAAYRTSVLTAAQDVEDAFARIAASNAIVAARIRSVSAQRSAKASATRAFQQGEISERDRIVADQAVLASDVALTTARAQRSQAVVRLYRVLGGGWTNAAS